jgi:hypothetical protein
MDFNVEELLQVPEQLSAARQEDQKIPWRTGRFETGLVRQSEALLSMPLEGNLAANLEDTRLAGSIQVGGRRVICSALRIGDQTTVHRCELRMVPGIKGLRLELESGPLGEFEVLVD